MKTTLTRQPWMLGLPLSVCGLLGLTAAHAYEQARVISSTPIVQQVNVPQQNCQNVAVAVQEPKSGAGAVMGAIAGGVIGNVGGIYSSIDAGRMAVAADVE